MVLYAKTSLSWPGSIAHHLKCSTTCKKKVTSRVSHDGSSVWNGFQTDQLINRINFCTALPRLQLNTKIGLQTTTHPPTNHHTNSQAVISQLLLARYGSNFKQRVLGTYNTDQNCHHNICLGNICPGDICPYQQYQQYPL